MPADRQAHFRALVAAHEIVRGQGLETNLLIAGNPDPANPASVSLQEVNEWAQRPGITWLGHVKDIASLWRQCHFAVPPSHPARGFPGALMEAAALRALDRNRRARLPRDIPIDGQTGPWCRLENPQVSCTGDCDIDDIARVARTICQQRASRWSACFPANIIGEHTVRLYDQMTKPR